LSCRTCRPGPPSQACRPGSSAGRLGRCRRSRWTRACLITRSDREGAKRSFPSRGPRVRILLSPAERESCELMYAENKSKRSRVSEFECQDVRAARVPSGPSNRPGTMKGRTRFASIACQIVRRVCACDHDRAHQPRGTRRRVVIQHRADPSPPWTEIPSRGGMGPKSLIHRP